ncbi:MAG: ice-binding family protein [Actinoplanes sp.]
MTLHYRSYRLRAGVGIFAAAATLGLLLLLIPGPADAAESPVNLNTTADFSVLAGSAVTNTGPSTLAQGLGVHPGTAASGFPPGTVAGETHLADGVALQAKNDLTAAYTDAAGRTPFTNLASQLGGSTLTPGVYRLGAAQLTGQLTLNAQNDTAAVFIFQISSTLTTAANSDVVFINGASPCNVFWQVTSSATLGTNSDLVGNVMALTSITMNTGADLVGRALAGNGAVTLDDNDITTPFCAAATSPPGTPPATSPGTPPATPPGTLPGTPPATLPATPPGTLPGTPPGTSPGAQPTATAPNASSPAAGPPVGAPPRTSAPPPFGNPPRLPLTGTGPVPALLATGLALVALGVVILLGYRKRHP